MIGQTTTSPSISPQKTPKTQTAEAPHSPISQSPAAPTSQSKWQVPTFKSNQAQPHGPLSKVYNSKSQWTSSKYPQTPKMKFSAEANKHVYAQSSASKSHSTINLTSFEYDLEGDFLANGLAPHRAAPPPPSQTPPVSSAPSSSPAPSSTTTAAAAAKVRSPSDSGVQTTTLSELLAASPQILHKDPQGEKTLEKGKNEATTTTTTAAATTASAAGNDFFDDIDEHDIVYNEDKTIKYASMKVLVGRMISGKGSDANFMNHFLLTMNLHTTPDAFLDVLIGFFKPEMGMAYKLRVFVVLKTWVEKLWNSSTDPNLINRVREFAKSSEMENPAKTLIRLIEQKVAGTTPDNTNNTSILNSTNTNTTNNNTLNTNNSNSNNNNTGQQKDYIFAEEVPPPVIPVSYLMGIREPPSDITLNTVSLVEIARQLALGEIELFKAIKPWEFQNLNFNKKDKSLAPNIHAYSRHFNAMSNWVSWRILECNDLKKRVRALERVIDLAYLSSKVRNYNAVNELISACTSSAVYRLHKTWSAISPEHTARFKELSDLVAPTKSYAALRNKLHTIHPPCVPYIGIYQTDLTFIEEGNPTLNESGLVNWKKCRLQANIIIEIQTYQQSPYVFIPIPWIRDYFLNPPQTGDENAMWNASITIEPKEKKPGISTPESDVKLSSTAAATGGGGGNSVQKALSGDTIGVGVETEPAENPCVDEANPDSAKKAEIRVLLPGKSAFLHVSVKEKLVMEPILRHAAEKGLIDYAAAAADETWKLMMFSDMMPFGVEQMDGSAIPTTFNSFFALYHGMEIVDVVYPEGFAFGPKPFKVAVDYQSPLLSLAHILKTIAAFPSPYGDYNEGANEQPVSEILFMNMKVSSKVEFVWLNSNLSLKDQGFDVSKDKIVVVPIELLLHIEEGAIIPQYPSKNAHTAGVRLSFTPMASSAGGNGNAGMGGPGGVSFQMQLVKANARSMTRSGVLTKQILAGTTSSFRKGTIPMDKEKRRYLLADNFLFCYKESNSQTVLMRVWPLEFCNVTLGIIHNTQICIAVKYIPQHSRSASSPASNFRPRFMSNGSNGSTANDPSYPPNASESAQGGGAAAATSSSSSGTAAATGAVTSSTQPDAADAGNDGNGANNNDCGSNSETSIENSNDDAAEHKDDKGDITLFAGCTDTMTRSWFGMLSERSRVNYRTHIFGEPIEAICRRERSVVPLFLVEAIDQLIMKALRVETLLSAQPPSALVERYKDAINAGVCPNANDPMELACLAQCVLMFFTELPDPAIPGRMYPLVVSYCNEFKSANIGALRNIIAKVSDSSSNALFCLLMFFKLWGDKNEVLRKAAVTVGQVITSPHENARLELHNPTSIVEVATRFGEDILNNFTKLNLRRLNSEILSDVDSGDKGGTAISEIDSIASGAMSEGALSQMQRRFSKSENVPTPVTVFSQKQLMAVFALNKSECAAPGVPQSISPGNPGADTESGEKHAMKKQKSGLSFSARISQHFKRDKKTGALKNVGYCDLGDSVVILPDTSAGVVVATDEVGGGGSKISKSDSVADQSHDGLNSSVRKKSNSSGGGKTKEKKNR